MIGAPCHHPPSNHQLWAHLVVFPCIGNIVQERRYKNETCRRPFSASFLRWCFFLKIIQPGGSHLDRFQWPKRTCCLVVFLRSFFAKLGYLAKRTFHATDVRHVEYQSGGCRHMGRHLSDSEPWRKSGESTSPEKITSWRKRWKPVHQ